MERPRDRPSHANRTARRRTLEHDSRARAAYYRQAIAQKPLLLDIIASRPRRRVFSDAPLLGPLDPVNTENLRILDSSIDDPVGFWVWSQLFFQFHGPYVFPEVVAYY